MKKTNLSGIVMGLALTTFISAAFAQNSIRALMMGKQGKSVEDVRLSPEQQVSFVPADAKNIFGLDQKSDLVLKRTETDNLGEVHYRYVQTYQNIPVENSMYIVHTKNGMLKGMSGAVIIDFDEQMPQQAVSSLTKANAIQSAINFVAAQKYAWQDADAEKGLKDQASDINATYYPSAELVWFSPGDEINARDLHLCYKVDVYALQPLSRAYYFVDAKTGNVLGKKDELFYSDATGTCNTAYSGTQTIHSDFTGSSYRLRDLTKGNGVVTVRSTTGHTDYTSASATWNLTGSDQYALDAHYGVSQTWSFYNTNYGRNSVDNAGKVLTSYVNETATVNNAYWDGSIMHFGVRSTGAGITAIDVTAHELTHGVTQYTSGLNYSNQSGAMNESMSDIFGKSVQFWSKPADVNWLMSNDMNWNIRNMANPNQFSQPDTYLGTYWYTGTSDNGGVHTNSGVGNFMFYLLVTGGSGTNDIGNAYTVTGLGLTKADAIIYRSETTYLTSTSQYSAWRTACINAATDLYGANSPEVTQVMNAWYAVGIGTAGGSGGSCGTPSGLTAGSLTNTSATLSWSNTGAVSYNLQWKLTSGSTWTTVSGLTTTSYNLTGLVTCTSYQFQVQGVCASSSSAYSTAASFSTTGCTTTYCASAGTNTTYEYINRVALGTINNTSGNNGGYGNYTALSTNLAGGTSNTITLVPGFAGTSYTEAWKVYVDYNHNGVFTDAGENVATTSGTGTRTASFTVPTSALNGATRMRVQMKYSTAATNSCTTFTYGEVEDYTVNITGNAQFGASDNADQSTIENSNASITGIVLFPNPAKNDLNVEFTGVNDQNVKIVISNLMGQQVIKTEERASEGLNSLKLDISTLKKGVYIFEMENNGIVTRKNFSVTE